MTQWCPDLEHPTDRQRSNGLRITRGPGLSSVRPHLGQRYALRSSCGEGTKIHTLERGMRMMKVDPSPGLLRTSMLPL